MLQTRTTSVAEGRNIPLVDEDNEKQEQIEDFLNLILGKDTSTLLGVDHWDRCRKVIALLKKYDCAAAIETLKMSVRLTIARPPLRDEASPFRMFLISAMLGDPLGCKEAIPIAGPRIWKDRAPWVAEFTKATPNQVVQWAGYLDVSGMREEDLAVLPLRYVLGLARASRCSKPNGQLDWDMGAEEFYRIVTT